MARLLSVATIAIVNLVLAAYGYSQVSSNTSSSSTAPAAVQEEHLDSYIEVLRSDLRAKKAEIIASGMNFNDKESAAFWPVYRNYELDLSKLNDQRVALIKEYAAHYDSLTPDEAEKLAKQSFDLQDKETNLKREYFKKFTKVLPANRVAKFFQIDNRLGLLMNVQIASELPMIE